MVQSVNQDLLRKELELARKRLVGQRELVKSAQDSLASAITLKMKATESAVRSRLPRLQSSVAETERVVDELEKATGGLKL